MKKLPAWLLFVFLLAGLIAAALFNIHWLRHHRQPILIGHELLLAATEQLQEFERNPIQQIHLLLTEVHRPQYCLYNLSAVLTVFLFGRTYIGLTIVSTVYSLLFALAIYGIGRARGLQWGALFAAYFALILPAAVAWSRIFSPNIGLMTLSALGMWLLVVSNWGLRWLPLLALSFLFPLALRFGESVSENLQLVAVLLLMTIVVFIYRFGWLQEKRKAAAWRLLVFVGLLACLLNYDYLEYCFRYLWQEGVARAGDRYGGGNIFQRPGALIAYAGLIVDQHLGMLFSFALLVATIILALKHERGDALYVAYFFLPFVIVSLVAKKNHNYVFAFLPAAPILLGLAAERITKWRLGLLFSLGLLIAGSIVAIAQSAERIWPPPLAIAPRAIFYQSYFQTANIVIASPESDAYPPETIARQLASRGAVDPSIGVLLVGSLSECEDTSIFRFLLRLANWENRWSLFDPYVDIQTRSTLSFYYKIDTAAPMKSEPKVLIVYPCLESRMDNLPPYQAEQFVEYLSGRTTNLISEQRKEFIRVLSDGWVKQLNSIPWTDYRRRTVTFNSSQMLSPRYSFYLFDRPDRGWDLTY